MAEILVGLTNNKTSFWDPNTRTNLSLSNKTKKIVFDENAPNIAEHLERICHGLYASSAAIRLYEGKIPDVAVEHWKAKFDFEGLKIAKKRADKVNAKSVVKEVQAQAVKAEAKAVETPVKKATTKAKPKETAEAK